MSVFVEDYKIVECMFDLKYIFRQAYGFVRMRPAML